MNLNNLSINELIWKVDFNNPDKYVMPNLGQRTEVTDEIKNFTDKFKSREKNYDLVYDLLELMNDNVKRLGTSSKEDFDNASRDKRKFTRSATEILKSGERNGCCEGSTLFTTIARSIGIPSIQVITFKKNSVNDGNGHFFTACYIDDEWKLINSDVHNKNQNGKLLFSYQPLNLKTIDVHSDFLAWAFVDDYSNISCNIHGDILKIDSINNMKKTQMINVKRLEDIQRKKEDLIY